MYTIGYKSIAMSKSFKSLSHAPKRRILFMMHCLTRIAAPTAAMRFCSPGLSLVGLAAVLDPKTVTSTKASQKTKIRPFPTPTATCETATLAIG